MLTIMDPQDSHQRGQIPSTISALSPAEADALMTLSGLSRLASSGRKEQYSKDHPLAVSCDDTYHEVKCLLTGKVRSGKRKRRGKCVECGTNTRYYCVVCDPGAGRCRHWCCPNATGNNKRMCHTNHKKRHAKATSSIKLNVP